VGLSLSLFVLLDRQISDQRFRSLAVFFMGAQALLTLVIQGTTMPWLLQARICAPIQGWYRGHVLGFLERGRCSRLSSRAPPRLAAAGS